jgi:hypothetical protein
MPVAAPFDASASLMKRLTIAKVIRKVMVVRFESVRVVEHESDRMVNKLIRFWEGKTTKKAFGRISIRVNKRPYMKLIKINEK